MLLIASKHLEKNMTTSKHLVFSVVNDLSYDQRMYRICSSLVRAGYQVTLIGREKKTSQALPTRPFKQIRFRLWFHKGKLFYLEYNLRLLWHFLWHGYDLFGAIDLDTIVPHFLAARIKGRKFTYDAHEYFPELPEIIHRPFVHWVWQKVEQSIVPHIQHAYTINQSYADLFKAKYGTHFSIVRNATILQPLIITEKTEKYILYQGAVNVGRGVEEMIRAMQYIDCKLYICGKGDVYQDCLELVKQLNLQEKVRFFGFVPPKQLRAITLKATLGFTFFTKEGMSYYLSLANRFFDYFHAGVPQLCVDYPEYRRINEQFEIALLLKDLDVMKIAEAVNRLLKDKVLYARLQQNCLQARETINWQAEEKQLRAVYADVFGD